MLSLELAYLTTFFLNSAIHILILKNSNTIDYVWEIIGICILMISVGIFKQLALQLSLKNSKHYTEITLKERVMAFLVKIKMIDGDNEQELQSEEQEDERYKIINTEKAI